MADEVVGSVTVNVQGNTEPLKRDIRQAAVDAGKAIDDSIGKGAAGSAITDNIVEQVGDAEQPSEREGQKIGRAIVRGVSTGSSRLDIRTRITSQLRDIEAPLRSTGERIRQTLAESVGVNEAPLRAVGQKLNRALTDAMGGLSDTGSAIGREWDKRLENIDYRIARAISVGPRKAALEAARDMGIAWDRALTRVDDRIGRMSFAPFRDKVADFGRAWDSTLTRMDDRVGAMSFTPLIGKIHEIGSAWDRTLTRMDDRVGRFDPLETLKAIPGRWDTMLTRMDDRVGRFDPAVTFRNSMNKISEAAQKFNPSLAGVKAWQTKFRSTLADDRGAIAIGGFVGTRIGDGMFAGISRRIKSLLPQFGKSGEAAGKKTGDGMKKSMLQAGVEKAFLGLVTKAATIGPLIAFGVRAAVPVLTGLIGQVSVLATGLAGLGAVGGASLATMIPGVLALKLAFAGLDAEAKKALSAKFTTAMGDLAGFKERVRNEIIPSLLDATKTISKLAPEINKMGKEAAKAGGMIAESFAKMLVGRKEEIGDIFGNSSKVMTVFGKAGTAAVDVIINALGALQPLVERVVTVLSKNIGKIQDSLNLKIDSGAFAKTMEEWYDRGVLVLGIMKNLGSFIASFFGAAANSSDTFLTLFKNLTQEWADWANSIEGELTLKHMFEEAVPVVKEVWGLLGDIAGLFTESFTGDSSGLVDFVRTLRTSVIPGIERFQQLLRDSGIQEGLYDLANAVFKVFESGGGVGIQVFLDTLTIVVEVIGQLLDVLGPVIVPLTTFLTLFKAMAIAKSAFGGLLGLPAMLTGIVTPANNATKAMKGMQPVVAGANAGKGAAGVGRFAGAMTKLGGAFNVALLGYAAFATIPKMVAEDIPDSTKRVNEFSEALEKGAQSVNLLGQTQVGKGFMKSMDFLPNVHLLGNELTALDRIAGDLDTSVSASINRWGADVLGVDVAGIEGSRAAVDDLFKGIEQYATATGDVVGAREQLEQLTIWMENHGIKAEEYAPKVAALTEVILDLQAAAGGKFKEGGVSFLGDFSTTETALASIGKAFDTHITGKIDAIRASAKYKDPITGGLNPAGMKAIVNTYKDANLDMINGIDNAISEADAQRIHGILDDTSAFDKYGEMTQETMTRIAKILPDALDKNSKVVKQRFADLNAILRSTSSEKVGTKALKLYVDPASAKTASDQVQGLVGDEVIRLRAELQEQGKTEEEIDAILADRTLQIFADAQVYAATEKLSALMGADYNVAIDAALDPGQIIDVEGQLLRMTADGTWEAVIGTEAKTARAEEAIYKMVKGPDGEWHATISTGVDPADAKQTNEDLYALAADRTATIHVNVVTTTSEGVAGKYWNAKSRKFQSTPVYSGQQPVKGGVALQMLPPSGGDEVVVPPTISAGGPTTMGFGASPSISPFAGQRAVIQSAPGGDMQGSTNVWTGQDKDKAAKNVTINNYYPEPERASDTVAMSLRVARYV